MELRAPKRDLRDTGARAVPLVVGAYALVGALGLAIGALRGEPNVFVTRSLRLSGERSSGHLASALGGLALALLVVALTRALVRSQAWAAALHEDLAPVARALGSGAVVPVALASSLGEELLFRGALVPWIGVAASSALFGLLHQVPGRSRAAWIAFASVVGALLGALFVVTGSLLGPILAHALVNAVNLRFLQTHEPPRARPGDRRLRR